MYKKIAEQNRKTKYKEMQKKKSTYIISYFYVVVKLLFDFLETVLIFL